MIRVLGYLAAFFVAGGSLFGIALGAPVGFYPWHVAIALAWTAALGSVALLIPQAWRRLLWPAYFALGTYLTLLAWAIAASSRYVWGVNVDRGSFLNLAYMIGRAAGYAHIKQQHIWFVLAAPLLALLALFFWRRQALFRGPASPSKALTALLLACLYSQIFLFYDGTRPHLRRWVPPELWQWDPLLSTWYSSGHSLFRSSSYRLRSRDRDRQSPELAYPAPRKRKRIVLFIVDALRRDRLPFYGYHRQTAPFWSSLASQGHWARVKEGYSPSPESVGGISSLMQPKWPRNISNEGLGVVDLLHKHGFKAHFFVSGDHDWLGLRGNYGAYQDSYSSGRERKKRGWFITNDAGVLAAMGTLPPAQADGSDFIMIHFMSVHDVGVKDERFNRWLPVSQWWRMSLSWKPVTPEQALGLRNEYDNAVLQADDELRRAWETLGAKGYLKDAVVAIVADHGQGLGEYGKWGHCIEVTELLTKVPMTFWSDKPLRVQADRLASLIDVGPTLLAEAGLPILESWDGRPLWPETPPRKVVAMEDVMYEKRWAAVLWHSPWGRLKYMRRSLPGQAPDREYAFALDKDPDERLNVMPALSEEQQAALKGLAAEYLGD